MFTISNSFERGMKFAFEVLKSKFWWQIHENGTILTDHFVEAKFLSRASWSMGILPGNFKFQLMKMRF